MKTIFWLPEGPMLKTERDGRGGFILHIHDLNPEQHTRWALSRDEILTIGRGSSRKPASRPPAPRERRPLVAEHSTIEWTDATWNPITGCAVVSPGCSNCYAMRLAGTRLAHHPSRAGLTRDTKAGPVWTGEVRFNEEWLTQPLRWKRPRQIFVCAHGDLFAEGVPDAWIDRVFAVMALAPQHTFQVLTKRSARMREYMADPHTPGRIYDLVCDLAVIEAVDVVLVAPGFEAGAPTGRRVLLGLWPVPSVWVGVSAEDQRRADERIPDLLATPAAVRWVSAEPLLGPLDLWLYLDPQHQFRRRLDWIVAGGESGPGARPMLIEWARSLRDQCNGAGVAFFMKQLSGLNGRAIKNIAQFPADLRVRENPRAA